MFTKSSELLIDIQRTWEEAQQQLVALRKQVQERTTLECFLSEREQAEQRRQKALGDLGLAIYEEIEKGALMPPKRWEGLLERVKEALRGAEEQRQKLSELLDEGQALLEAKGPKGKGGQ
ncbi:MAG: hypothetical protein FWD46_01050 [Cystobacterineae bacterium]|nr:hypothetical protein [Cystobacterineae bacterium]